MTAAKKGGNNQLINMSLKEAGLSIRQMEN